jgi:ABC-type amino acid transport substrate-binding protein
MKKRIVVIGLVLIMALTLAGCAKTDQAWKRIQDAGKMIVATSPDYPPFESIDDQGNIVGFDIDLINAMAEEVGVTVELQSLNFEAIITAVQTGQADMGMSGFSVDPERAEMVDFTDPYFIGG